MFTVYYSIITYTTHSFTHNAYCGNICATHFCINKDWICVLNNYNKASLTGKLLCLHTVHNNMFIPSCFGVFIVVPITAVIQLFRVQIMPVYHVYTVRWMVVALPVQIFLVRSRSPFYLIIGFELFLGAALLHLIALQ